jgi:N6-L-threonylcarbamoyladenine synthase
LEGDAFGFSFSGIKTSVLYYMRDNHPNGISQQELDDICASFQASIVEVLVNKTLLAAKELGVKNIALAGGVSANSRLRSEMSKAALKAGIQLCIPKSEYCTDNAAMIAALGYRKYFRNSYSPLSETAVASLELAAHS